MLSLAKQFGLVFTLTLLGSAFSLLRGIAEPPWVPPAALGPGEITLSQAEALNPIWLDARPAADFEAGHAPEAVWTDPDDWETAVVPLMDRWLAEPRPIVVYCGSEQCGTSQRIAEQLRAMLPDATVFSLKGGWEAFSK